MSCRRRNEADVVHVSAMNAALKLKNSIIGSRFFARRANEPTLGVSWPAKAYAPTHKDRAWSVGFSRYGKLKRCTGRMSEPTLEVPLPAEAYAPTHKVRAWSLGFSRQGKLKRCTGRMGEPTLEVPLTAEANGPQADVRCTLAGQSLRSTGRSALAG